MARGQTVPQPPATDDAANAASNPSCNGSQIALQPFLRALDGNSQVLEAEEVYFISLGAAVASSNKTAVQTVKHSILLSTGFISKQKYGILKPIPRDGFNRLYSESIAAVAGGAAIPDRSVFTNLPVAPTADDHLPSNHVIAPDRLMLVDLKLKGSILKMITSSGRRRHYADSVGPSGIELLNKLSADSKLADSRYSQTAHSRRLKAQMAETMKMKLSHVSLEEFDSIKDTLEDLNDQFDDINDKMSETQRSEHYISLLNGLKSSNLKQSLLLDLRVNQVVHGDLQGTISAITRTTERKKNVYASFV